MPALVYGFGGHPELGAPDFMGIMLHPSGLGKDLPEFFLGDGRDLSGMVKYDGPGRSGSLVE